MSHRILIIEIERIPASFGLGAMLSYDSFMGVSVLFGWWQLNVGLRGIGL